jgi:hypothetical protein
MKDTKIAELRAQCCAVLDDMPAEGLRETLTALREFNWYYTTRKQVIPASVPKVYKVDGARFVGLIERPHLIIESDYE